MSCMKPRRAFQILLLIGTTVALACLWFGGRRVANMKAEYATAEAVSELTAYVVAHEGEWPPSAEALRRKPSEDIWIDYSLSSESILAKPEILEEAVRPKTGRFQTYPYHKQNLRSLLKAIREARTEAIH